MKKVLDKIAKDVVIHHVCHCDTAVEHPEHDDPQEHVFTVDGEDFPWLISERGPVVKRLHDDLYSVDVEIVLVDKATFDYVPFVNDWIPVIPIIGGVEFPWLLTEDECHLTFGRKVVPKLRLAFIARHVGANIPIEDCRPGHDDEDMIFCSSGDLISGSKERCRYGCDQVVDGSMWDHIEQAHPERISTGNLDGIEYPMAQEV